MVRSSPEIPTTEDLEITLRVLKVMAGNKDQYPYLPQVATQAEVVIKEILSVLAFRKR